MDESDFESQAQSVDGIRCVLYPTRRPILHTRQPVTVNGIRIEHQRWTDGGSVPRWAHVVAHPLGYLFPAFLLHDVSLFDGHGWDESNRRFDEAMKELGASAWQRLTVLSAVRANGQWQKFRALLGWRANHVQR